MSCFAPWISPAAKLPGPFRKVRERYLIPVALAKMVAVAIGRMPGTIASYKSDLTLIERTYVLGAEGLVRLTRRPRVLDTSDAIWLTTPGGNRAAERFARHMDAVIAGNTYLANWYSQHCNNVFIVPDGIDITRFRPRTSERSGVREMFVVGWTGTSVNFKELYAVEPALVRFLTRHSDARLCVVSDRAPQFKRLKGRQLIYKRWTPEAEGTDLHGFDVGIMPMQDSAWARGKNSNKMLCYMAAGLPVVVSPVGTNSEVLALGDVGHEAANDAEWYLALEDLYNNPSACDRFGRNGRAVVNQHFRADLCADRLASAFATILLGH